MKSLKTSLLAVGCACGLITGALAQDPPEPKDQPDQQSTPTTPTAPDKKSDDTSAADSTATAAKDTPPDDTTAKAKTKTTPRAHARPSANGMLTMNFRGAPLELVLNYLIDAAGFIVLPETTISGKVDVWSNEPVTKDKAVELLDHVLRKNGLAAIRDGQTLTICSLDDAKKKNIPTETHYDPKEILADDKIVTEIIPVRSVNAAQAIKELSALKSVNAEWAADEAGNAIVMTDSRVNIRRIAEIVNALDLASSGVNVVRVFALKYADSKTVVTVVKDLFPTQDARGGPNGGGGFQGFRGFGGRGGGGGGGGGFNPFGGGAAGNDGSAQARTPKVMATSEDRSNSLVVSAPDSLMSIIENVVTNMDQPVQDITEVHVFRLKNADPGEMVDLLSSLFPDETNSSNANQPGQQFRFGGFRGFGGFGGGGGASANTSDRMKRMTRVIAVADKRTSSVVVTASEDLMEHNIKPMIEQLDLSQAHKQHAYVISLQNASAEDVLQVMNDLFPTSTKSSRLGSGSQSGSPLTQRSTTLEQQNLQSSSQSAFGGTSFGSSR